MVATFKNLTYSSHQHNTLCGTLNAGFSLNELDSSNINYLIP
ncbi:hypothetical protein PANA5342_0991 [Pantoea ananatis LMG 5342]|nr:hypothetical protein PANA5342_0991 [Pantoea ananatis LMG 5342]